MRIWAGALLALCAGACSIFVDLGGFTGGADVAHDGGAVDATLEGSAWTSPLGARHRKAITIDHAQVAGELANFPVVVSLDADPELKTASSGGGVENANGDDIMFGDATGQVAYPHELERYDGGTGTLIAWVRVPLLSPQSDTTFYVYYGSSRITSPTARPLDVWDDSYAGVWHLDEPSGPRRDSARNRNDLREAPETIPGGTDAVLGGAARVRTAGEDRLVIADGAQTGLDLTGPMTISFWMKATTSFGEWRNVVAKWSDGADGPSPNDAYYVGEDSSGGGYRIKFFMEDASGGTVIYGRTIMPIGTWHYLAAVYDGTAMRVYVNGLADATPVPRSNGARNSSAPFDVGNKSANPPFGHDGPLDEVHVANVARSAAWIRTEYANQSAPKSFAKLGPQQDL